MSNERFEWHYVGESGQLGPLSETQLLDLVEHGVVRADTLVWKVGMTTWTPAGSLPKIAARMQPTFAPPPVAAPPPMPNASVNCPRDGTPLRRESRSGVEIDWCPTCRGVWLDRGELENLIRRQGDDDDDDDRGGRRRSGFLGNVFDIFD